METCSGPAGTGEELASLTEHQDKNQLGVSAGAIFGMKKLQYNSEDFGTIVYSTAHSAAAKAITGR